MRRLLLLVFLPVLVLPAAAGASEMAPNNAVTAVVFGKSIGAMKLGMTRAQALKAWGEQGDCQLHEAYDAFCFWTERGLSSASITFSDSRKVKIIRILATPKGSGPFRGFNEGGSLREFKFNPDVGLGSTRAQVNNSLRQFPPAGKVAKRADGSSYLIDGPGSRRTGLLFTGSRLTGVAMYL